MRRTAIAVAVGMVLLLALLAPAYGSPAAAAGNPLVSATETPSVDPTVTPPPEPAPDPAWVARFLGHRVHAVKKLPVKYVALTFDDGPNFRTKKAIAILERYGAKGTFFVTGSMSKKRGGATANRLVISTGNELANHTWSHNRLNKTYAADLKAINRLEKLLKAQTGQGTRWVRAMGGAVNKTGLKATKNSGHLYAQWSVSIADSVRGTSNPHRLYHNVVDHVKTGSVVLMHVTHPETLAALPAICAELKARGYKMVTLSEMAEHGKPWPAKN